ncbi:hypothetical protein AUP68_11330 [Ilyonectria robusta]
MSSPGLLPLERRIGLRRSRSSSPSDQLHREKRQRTSRQVRFSPPLLANRPHSASSTATDIGQYYGVGDEDTLGNLFASYPQTFSTFPQPHGSQGLHEPAWDLRFDYEIHLQNDFPSGRTRSQRVRAPIPGPELDPLPPYSPPESAQRPRTATRTEFESAMKIVQEVVGEGRRLTIDLARSYERVRAWRERWGWSPLSSEAYESPPPYSPQRRSPTQTPQVSPSLEAVNASPIRQSPSPIPDPIPNPPIPGDPAPSAEALFNSVNAFAKDNGFGIVRRNAYSYKGRQIRFSFQCDRFGQPRAPRGAGLRQRKSRKCGCQWMVIAEALEYGKWLLRQHPSPEHSQHNHRRSIKPSAHPSHRRLTSPVRTTIESTSRRIGIRARDVRAVVEEQHPESQFTQRDIYNARALINRDKLNGYAPTAALIKLFDEMEVPYLVKWADDQPNRLLGLVWTFPYCFQMWKRFPEDEILTAREYLGLSGDYLGELRTVISSKGLGLINKQYRIARKAMPTGKNPFPDPLPECNDDCSVSIELGVPCCHKIYSKLGSATSFTKWDVHPRWRLRESSSRDPYRRILDPKIATALRGRPKNTAQPVPARLAIGGSSQAASRLANRPASQPTGRMRGRPAGIRNKSTLAKLALEASQLSNTQASSQVSTSTQRQTRSQLATLGSGRTTGVRASGRRTQPSIRRTRSQWELVNSDEDILPSIVVRE